MRPVGKPPSGRRLGGGAGARIEASFPEVLLAPDFKGHNSHTVTAAGRAKSCGIRSVCVCLCVLCMCVFVHFHCGGELQLKSVNTKKPTWQECNQMTSCSLFVFCDLKAEMGAEN